MPNFPLTLFCVPDEGNTEQIVVVHRSEPVPQAAFALRLHHDLLHIDPLLGSKGNILFDEVLMSAHALWRLLWVIGSFHNVR